MVSSSSTTAPTPTWHKIYCVIHMASLKAVGESCKRPFYYYKANLFSAINLIEVFVTVHVVDLAKGHLAAMKKIDEKSAEQPKIYNLGTGKGISVLEIIKAFEKHTGQKIPYKIVGRREGDVDTMIADASKAGRELGWKTARGFEEMCQTLWNFQSKNPYGYQDKPATE